MIEHYIGLDVSMNSTGWAVLSFDGTTIKYVDSGIIKANTKHSHGLRLRKQRNHFVELLETYPNAKIAREAGFSRHIKSTQVLYKAYGVTEEVFADKDLVEYAATTIKKYVTGNGRADKGQIEFFVRDKIKFKDGFVFASDDESDAVAIALTHIEKEKERGGNGACLKVY